ncbi:MAG: hypothetical protein WD739_06520 [Actinomycetota bacterium]
MSPRTRSSCGACTSAADLGTESSAASRAPRDRYRSSTDGGQTWSAEADISDADDGATYKTAAGFASEYGDYGAIDITNTGTSVAVWGEGASFSAGPGGIWFNRQP